MKKTILLTACLALTLGGCAEMDTKPAAAAKPAAVANPELDKMIADAEKEIAAAKKGGLWRDTEKFLDEAKKAKAEGKADEAMKGAGTQATQLVQKQVAAGRNRAFPQFAVSKKKPGAPAFYYSLFGATGRYVLAMTQLPLSPTPDRDVFSVSRLNREAKALLEGSFPLLWVEGELSNLSRPASGHLYFTLKDAQAQVRCALFRGSQRNVSVTPKDGMQVLVRARVSLYEGRGDYQLIVESLEEAGEGALRRAPE
jgi:hypothetical protein